MKWKFCSYKFFFLKNFEILNCKFIRKPVEYIFIYYGHNIATKFLFHDHDDDYDDYTTIIIYQLWIFSFPNMNVVDTSNDVKHATLLFFELSNTTNQAIPTTL